MTVTPPGSLFSRRTDYSMGDPVPNPKGSSKVAPAPIAAPTKPLSEASARYEALQRTTLMSGSGHTLATSASSVSLAASGSFDELELEDIQDDDELMAGDFTSLNELLNQVEEGGDEEWPAMRIAWDGPDPTESTMASSMRRSIVESPVEDLEALSEGPVSDEDRPQLRSHEGEALEIISLDGLSSAELSLVEGESATTSPTSSARPAATPFDGVVGFAGPRDIEPKENFALDRKVYRAAKNAVSLGSGAHASPGAMSEKHAVGTLSSAVGVGVSEVMHAVVGVAIPVIPLAKVIYTNVYKAIQHANRPPVPKGMKWITDHARDGDYKVVPRYKHNLERYLNAAQIRVEQKIKLATAREIVSAGDGVLTGIAIGVPLTAPLVAAIKASSKIGAKKVIAMMKEEFSQTDAAKEMDEGLIALKSDLLRLRDHLRSRKASGISDSEPYRLPHYERGLLRIAKSLGWVSPKTPETLAGPLRHKLEGGDLHYNPVAKPAASLEAPDEVQRIMRAASES